VEKCEKRTQARFFAVCVQWIFLRNFGKRPNSKITKALQQIFQQSVRTISIGCSHDLHMRLNEQKWRRKKKGPQVFAGREKNFEPQLLKSIHQASNGAV
jgi:hypothetical protein